MSAPAAAPRPHRAPKALGGLAALVRVACCALPVLITAGVVDAGAGAVVGRLPAVAVALAVLAAGTWWYSQRRRSCSCSPKTAGQGGCGCKTSADPLKTRRPWPPVGSGGMTVARSVAPFVLAALFERSPTTTAPTASTSSGCWSASPAWL